MSSFKSMTKLTAVLKPAITSIQLIQLAMILGHCFVAVKANCGASSLFLLQIPNIFLLILMFAKFYVQSFLKKSRPNKKTH